MMVHAIKNAVNPMQTVKRNMAIKSKYSIYQIMSLACKMELAKTIPEEDSKLTYTSHEDETTGDKAERRYKFGWRARGEDRGWWGKEEQKVGYGSG
jgi:hypothetical protein